MRRRTENQLERFRTIAKRLVDDHSAQLFVTIAKDQRNITPTEVFYSHLDVLGKELKEQAESFMTTSIKTLGTELKEQILDTCKRYMDQFSQRNQPYAY